MVAHHTGAADVVVVASGRPRMQGQPGARPGRDAGATTATAR